MGLASRVDKRNESRLLRALEGEATPRVPFWLMRQAGRYLPEYRELRKTAGSFLDLCFTPDFATEVTLQPVRRFDMDAAILFSDILVVPYALGQTIDFVEGEGPRLGALHAKREFDDLDFSGFSEKLAPVYETVRRVRAALAPDKALIGFAGAPWTLACYMIQGQGDGAFTAARALAFSEPEVFSNLIDRLAGATVSYLSAQIANGANAVQIFDSWAGLLPEKQFLRWVVEPTKLIVSRLREIHPDVPVIGFPRGAGALYPLYAARTGVNGLGLDGQVPLPWILRECPRETCLQGNLDPVALLAGGQEMEKEVLRILDQMRGRPFIFNLGHGVIKTTPPGHVARLAEILRDYQR